MKPALLKIINTLDLQELIETQSEIQDIISTKQEEEKGNLRETIQELLTKSGLSIGEVFNIPATPEENEKPTTRRPARPKYRNPADESQTWTGRGRKPLWVVEFLENYDWQTVAKDASEDDKRANKEAMTAILEKILIEQA